MVLVSADLDTKTLNKMTDEIDDVDGVKFALGLNTVIGLLFLKRLFLSRL
jgi:hypothetical protein